MTEQLPSIVVENLTSLARGALKALAGLLLAHGIIAQTQQAEFIDLGLSLLTFAAGQAWSIWQKHQAAQVLMVALTTAKMTEDDAKGIVKTAPELVPTVLTPSATVPGVPLPPTM
jgi:hypothetical protein